MFYTFSQDNKMIEKNPLTLLTTNLLIPHADYKKNKTKN